MILSFDDYDLYYSTSETFLLNLSESMSESLFDCNLLEKVFREEYLTTIVQNMKRTRINSEKYDRLVRLVKNEYPETWISLECRLYHFIWYLNLRQRQSDEIMERAREAAFDSDETEVDSDDWDSDW